MKFLVFALVALFAVAHAVPGGRPNKPFGVCPAQNGDRPVYLMDEQLRHVFYECDSGKPIRQECPRGLVFNPRVNVCDYPSLDCEPSGPVGRCPTGHRGFFSLRYLRDGANVSVFYVCNRGTPIKYTCDGDLIFNTRYNACFTYL